MYNPANLDPEGPDPQAAGVPATRSGQPVDLQRAVRALRASKWLLALFAIVGAVLSATIYKNPSWKVYESKATLIYTPQAEVEGAPAGGGIGNFERSSIR